MGSLLGDDGINARHGAVRTEVSRGDEVEAHGVDVCEQEQLRDAVGALATRYERLANGDLNVWPAISLPVAPGGKPAKAK